MALFPLVGAVVSVMIFGRWYYMIMALLSPVMLFGNYFMDKKHGRKSHAQQVKEYKETKERIEKDAQEALRLERLERRSTIPDPASVLAFGTGPRTRLWERRRTDADHLLLRVGTGRVPSEVVLDDPEQDDHKRQVTWDIEDSPVALPLKDLGVIGIAGPGDSAQALARWAVAQTAVLHSPMDVQFCVLTENNAQPRWDWVRWLPHARPASGQDVNVLVGTDSETVSARVGELTQLLDARQKALKENNRSGAGPAFADPDIVVVWDGSRRLRSLPGVVRLLREGPAVAMYAICLDEEERFLPGECQAFVVAEPLRHSDTVNARPGSSPAAAAGGFPSFHAWHQGAQQTQQAAERAPELRLRVEQTGARRRSGVRPDFVSPPGAPGCPGRCRRCATSVARPRTPRFRPRVGSSTCSSWSPRRATTSPRAGAWAASPPWRSSVSRTTVPSASTSGGTVRTDSSPVRPVRVSRSCSRPSWPRSPSPTRRRT